MVCTFFGHKECAGLQSEKLYRAIEAVIAKGVDCFYVGNQGRFDSLVHCTLKALQIQYPHIRYGVVLAYFPVHDSGETDTMYPPIEGHPKFAISRRNRWMIHASDYCICYIDHTWGGAYQWVALSKRKGLQVINLGTIPVENL